MGRRRGVAGRRARALVGAAARPRRRRPSETRSGAGAPDMTSRDGWRRSSPAGRTTSPTSSSTSTTASTATARAALRARAARRGRHLRRARRARGAARRGAGGRHVLRPQPPRAVPARATASWRPAGSARSGRSASSTSAGCSRSSMSLSDDLRDELAGDRAAPALLLAGRALGALPLRRDLAPARPRRARRPPRPGEPGRRATGLQPPARLRRPVGDPYVPPPRLRPRDPLPVPRRHRRRPQPRCFARRVCSRRVVRRSSGRRSASSDGRVAAAPTSGAPCSAAARSPLARAHLELRADRPEGAGSLADIARAGRLDAANPRATIPHGRLREGHRDDRRSSGRRGRKRDGITPRRARCPRRHASRGKPPANADEANVKRAVRAAREQLAAIDQLEIERLPTKLREIANSRQASVALAERAGPSAARRSRKQQRITEWTVLKARAEMPGSSRSRSVRGV